MIKGLLIYGLMTIAPEGFREISPAICKQAYHIDIDGRVFNRDGKSIAVRGHCFIKQ